MYTLEGIFTVKTKKMRILRMVGRAKAPCLVFSGQIFKKRLIIVATALGTSDVGIQDAKITCFPFAV